MSCDSNNISRLVSPDGAPAARPSVRLLQHRPCWAVHLLARRHGLSLYTTNVDATVVMNLPTPVLQVGLQFYSADDCIVALARTIDDHIDPSRRSWPIDKFIFEYLKGSIVATFHRLKVTNGDNDREIFTCSKFWVTIQHQISSEFRKLHTVCPER